MNEEVSSSLEEAISKCQLVDVPADRFETIDRYCKALWSMNEKINLTRHTNYDLFVRRDLLDSYQLAKLLQENEEILDVGTGGGVPGVLVAILRPTFRYRSAIASRRKPKRSRPSSRSSTCRFPFMSNLYRPFWKTSRLIP